MILGSVLSLKKLFGVSKVKSLNKHQLKIYNVVCAMKNTQRRLQKRNAKLVERLKIVEELLHDKAYKVLADLPATSGNFLTMQPHNN